MEFSDVLTPSRQRSIIFRISKLNRVGTRILKSLKVTEELRMRVIDLKELLHQIGGDLDGWGNDVVGLGG